MKYITTLLVDDDYLVLQDLQSLVDWPALGFSIVATASNGKTALAAAEKYLPELIITDISMPVMDGFDFIETVQQKYPETYIVFISSYADFDYAKRAMRDGIRDYLLKNELTKDSLSARLLEVREALESRMQSRTRDLQLCTAEYFSASLDGGTLPKELLHRRYIFFFLSYRLPLEKLKSHFQHLPQYGSELYRHMYQEILSRFPGTIVFHLEELVIAAVPPKVLGHPVTAGAVASTAQVFQNIAVKHCTGEILSAYLTDKLSLEEGRQRFQRLVPLLRFQNSFPGEAQTNLSLLCAERFAPVQQSFPYQLLKSSLDHPEQFYEQLHGFLELLFDSRDGDSLFMLYHNLLLQMEDLSGHMLSLSSCNYFQDRHDFYDFIEEAYEGLRSEVRRISQTGYSASLTQAMEYMKQNFSDSSLTIEQIAGEVYLSASRLSVLFKQETGQTVNDYLTDLRISQAIHLLENSRFKIYEIAEKVGYKSSQYFSQIFSQRTGHKPIHFRQRKSIP